MVLTNRNPEPFEFGKSTPGGVDSVLTQIREHVPAVVVVPGTRPLEGVELGDSERRGGDRQGDRLVKSLLTGKAYASCTSLIRMFIAKAAPTLQASS